ncbi:cytochrome c [Deinococcus sp. Leaf326]|jgi:mono/diheme cytochrome c family protein|uniref:c-type cytochrome n=1 Tax=Deinococcus sp. Leaf326 TaxID=1736338 RepID=UPI0009E661AD|nr:cytochrome c [Deinococcus sp. Leaf326]
MNGRKNRWTAGNVTSWLLGVTLGLIVGLVLLIVIPRTIPSDATPGPEGTAATPVKNEAAGAAGAAAATEAAGSAESGMADGENAAGATSGTAMASGTAAETAQGDGNPGQGPTPSQPSTAESPTQETGAAASGAASSGAPSETGASNAADGDAAAGQQVFAGNCAGCHGQNAQGGIGPSLVVATDGPKAWTLAQFTTVLREGRTPERTLGAVMPRFSAAQISDQQVADIQAYIKTLQ